MATALNPGFSRIAVEEFWRGSPTPLGPPNAARGCPNYAAGQ